MEHDLKHGIKERQHTVNTLTLTHFYAKQ